MFVSENLALVGGVLVGFGFLQTVWLLIVPTALWCSRKRIKGIVRNVDRVQDKVWVAASYCDPANNELRVTDNMSVDPCVEYVPGYSQIDLAFLKFLWYRKAIPDNTKYLKCCVILGMIGLAAATVGAAILYEAGISSYDVSVIAMCLAVALLGTGITFTILLCGVDVTLHEYESGESASLLVQWEQMPPAPIIPHIH